jgi:hypothetical protein
MSFSLLVEIRGGLGLSVERDMSFVAHKPLSAYADAAIDAEVIRS